MENMKYVRTLIKHISKWDTYLIREAYLTDVTLAFKDNLYIVTHTVILILSDLIF